ncbi:TIGR03560 family F420-dependent LLM class oxidoreductase [Natrinema thermotolerans]|uniref:TIGR03560 family F420-dependent LLM class oxidoreductase n=1 Tax=Natrinema thermotolerans TaxID=121872 RepID=A0AAF0P8F8_9EURY|nr:TIGR03560 family F420-dependent LLM class oxidoreductase [Natrinema thermotolerans]QCC59459.1 TIGR03560 family F420-dependent LLM class oxidoreductase [Natrinema thermotolerans]WMT06432.1 TIGR03560 family F420-dependent LLM class oxidoreductase [Natrinema thermotolerans]
MSPADGDAPALETGIILPQYGTEIGTVRDTALEAERLGYDAVWLEDHFQSWIGDPRRATHECWTTLSALAEATDEIRLGTLVTSQSYRHPALLAKMAAQVDRISDGRLELGLGGGWYEAEYDRFGYEFREPPAERLRRLAETIEILQGLWTTETYSHEGRHLEVDLEDAFCEPQPVQEPHPPIWIGGGGEQFTLRYTAELADGWNYGTLEPAGFADKLDVLRDHCESDARYDEIRKSAELFVFVGETTAAAEAKRESFRDEFLPADGPSEPREFFLSGYLETAPTGTPAEVRDRLADYADAGIEEVMLAIPNAADDGDESLALLAAALAA